MATPTDLFMEVYQKQHILQYYLANTLTFQSGLGHRV